MNTNVTEKLIWVLDYVKDSADFVKEQSPLVAQEILNWGLFNYVLISTMCAVTVLVSLFLLKKYWKIWLEKTDGCVNFIVIVATILCMVGSIRAMANVVKIKIAPRMYLIDYVVETTKQIKN